MPCRATARSFMQWGACTPVPYSRLELDGYRGMVHRAGAQRQLRPALHLRHVHDGAVLRRWCGSTVCSAAQEARPRATLQVYWISIPASSVPADGRSLGAELRGHAPQRDPDRHRYRLPRRTVLRLLALAVEAGPTRTARV